MATIRKRGNSYQIRVSVGYDVNGNHKEQSMTWKPKEGMTEKQIEKELNRQAVMFEEECQRNSKAPSVTFQELGEDWLKNYAERYYKKSTLYNAVCRSKDVFPALGNYRIDKLKAYDIQQFINSLTEKGACKRGDKGYAATSLREYYSFIKRVLDYAVRLDLISENPCEKVLLPKIKNSKKQIYTKEQMRLLIEKLMTAPPKHKAFFILLSYTGLRRGELLGLEWKDIDFDSGLISICRTSNYNTEIGIYTDTPKTQESERTVKVNSFVLGVLQELKEDLKQQEIKKGDMWIKSDRLFVSDVGKPMCCNLQYQWLRKFCQKNDLPFYGIHSFRHFVASALISEGVDVATVAKTLGHSNVTITLNTYTHAFKSAQEKAEQAMNNVLDFVPQRQITVQTNSEKKLIADK